MHRNVLFAALTVAAAIIIPGCSSAPPPPAAKAEPEAKKEPAGPPVAVAAQSPYYEMYKMARTWSPDVLGLTLTCGELKDVKNEDGKCGQWTAVFVSASKKEARKFTYAVADSGAGDIVKGINVSGPLPWGGATPDSKVFGNSEVLVNSDAAYKTVAEKAAGWLKAHPNMKWTLTLGNSSRFAAPVWYIMWGSKANGYFAYVNATTGAIVTR